MSKKPEKVITIIHTGTGDSGYCRINGQLRSKASSIISYLGKLDTCQSYTHCLSGYRKPIQDYFFILGALVNSPDSEKYLVEIEKLYNQFKEHTEELIKDLGALTGFIRTSQCNGDIMFLRSLIREAELAATKAVQEGGLDRNHIRYLNFLSDYVFAMIWYVSAENSELELWCGL